VGNGSNPTVVTALVSGDYGRSGVAMFQELAAIRRKLAERV
jgi:hypothetical protein